MIRETPLRPFLSYYGGKWLLAPRYPAPLHSHIVEPFAGAAGYSTRYPDRQVTLVEANPMVAGVWSYLIRTSREEIERLPLLESGQPVSSLAVCQEARWLIGWWLQGGVRNPKQTLSGWARANPGSPKFWGAECRARIAGQVDRIRHWKIIHGDYRDASLPAEATWFVDPPYQGPAGRTYPFDRVDYAALAAWCKERSGQVIVCEQEGADWLPFSVLCPSASRKHGRDRASARKAPPEVIWTA